MPTEMKYSKVLMCLPILAGVMDLVENFCVMQLIRGYLQDGWDSSDELTAYALLIGPWASIAKWGFLGCSLFFVLKATVFKKVAQQAQHTPAQIKADSTKVD
eukprot:TRINITY_DN1307_c0_g1_i1.p1 TRINITY_DN1307_c0_g1~~TRINITY_DN1307_c0_g1_i1.p1  ORF type:complete len:102 (-),score=18.81 TRINITY_DN1307_c0_g1_i1:386-691(-)